MLHGFRVCPKSGAFINCGPSTARLHQAVENLSKKEKELDEKLAKADKMLLKLAKLGNVSLEDDDNEQPAPKQTKKSKREK